MDELREVCEALLRASRARVVRLLDEHGRELVHVGGESADRARGHVVWMPVTHGGAVLVVDVDPIDGSVGLARLRARKASEIIAKLLKSSPAGSAPPVLLH